MTGRGRGRGGRGRRGASYTLIKDLSKELHTTPNKLRIGDVSYEPEPTFPKFILPRPTRLTQDEVNMVKYYKTLRTKIREETPFYITVRKRPVEDEEDDGLVPPRSFILNEGITRYRDRYKPVKCHRQSLRGLPASMQILS